MSGPSGPVGLTTGSPSGGVVGVGRPESVGDPWGPEGWFIVVFSDPTGKGGVSCSLNGNLLV